MAGYGHGLRRRASAVPSLYKTSKRSRGSILALMVSVRTALSKDVREADGSKLLDNTVLVYGGGISDGDRHNHNDLPVLVAGGGSMFKTGRRIVYSDGTPMTNLFITCFDRIGLPTDRIGSMGDSTGKLAQLF
jgi:hypothetical protein